MQKQYNKINFPGNLNHCLNVNEKATIIFITKQSRATLLDFSQGTVKVILIYITLI